MSDAANIALHAGAKPPCGLAHNHKPTLGIFDLVRYVFWIVEDNHGQGKPQAGQLNMRVSLPVSFVVRIDERHLPLPAM
jgi:hypothetical protein